MAWGPDGIHGTDPASEMPLYAEDVSIDAGGSLNLGFYVPELVEWCIIGWVSDPAHTRYEPLFHRNRYGQHHNFNNLDGTARHYIPDFLGPLAYSNTTGTLEHWIFQIYRKLDQEVGWELQEIRKRRESSPTGDIIYYYPPAFSSPFISLRILAGQVD